MLIYLFIYSTQEAHDVTYLFILFRRSGRHLFFSFFAFFIFWFEGVTYLFILLPAALLALIYLFIFFRADPPASTYLFIFFAQPISAIAIVYLTNMD